MKNNTCGDCAAFDRTKSLCFVIVLRKGVSSKGTPTKQGLSACESFVKKNETNSKVGECVVCGKNKWWSFDKYSKKICQECHPKPHN